MWDWIHSLNKAAKNTEGPSMHVLLLSTLSLFCSLSPQSNFPDILPIYPLGLEEAHPLGDSASDLLD